MKVGLIGYARSSFTRQFQLQPQIGSLLLHSGLVENIVVSMADCLTCLVAPPKDSETIISAHSPVGLAHMHAANGLSICCWLLQECIGVTLVHALTPYGMYSTLRTVSVHGDTCHALCLPNRVWPKALSERFVASIWASEHQTAYYAVLLLFSYSKYTMVDHFLYNSWHVSATPTRSEVWL